MRYTSAVLRNPAQQFMCLGQMLHVSAVVSAVNTVQCLADVLSLPQEVVELKGF